MVSTTLARLSVLLTLCALVGGAAELAAAPASVLALPAPAAVAADPTLSAARPCRRSRPPKPP